MSELASLRPERGRRGARKLTHRARSLFALRELTLMLPGAAHPYRMVLPADPDAPLDQFATSAFHVEADHQATARNAGLPPLRAAACDARRILATGEHLPYWGLLWPSGQALAEALLAARETLAETPPAGGRGRTALELGCGLGLTATAALELGYRLIATDCFPEALVFCRSNTLRNLGRQPRTWLLDWRTPSGRAACLSAAPLDLLLAADVLYEEPDIAPLLDLAPRLLAPGGAFWLAEPGRRVSRAFVTEARARGWHDAPTEYVCAWPPDGDVVAVTVHRLTLP
jgi:predicted nicotinamide N-methyase